MKVCRCDADLRTSSLLLIVKFANTRNPLWSCEICTVLLARGVFWVVLKIFRVLLACILDSIILFFCPSVLGTQKGRGPSLHWQALGIQGTSTHRYFLTRHLPQLLQSLLPWHWSFWSFGNWKTLQIPVFKMGKWWILLRAREYFYMGRLKLKRPSS